MANVCMIEVFYHGQSQFTLSCHGVSIHDQTTSSLLSHVSDPSYVHLVMWHQPYILTGQSRATVELVRVRSHLAGRCQRPES